VPVTLEPWHHKLKKNYNILKFIKEHITFLGLLLYLLVTLGFVEKEMNSVLCENVKVNVEDSVRYKFIKSEDVVSLLKTMEIKMWGYSIDDIPVGKVEETVVNNMPMVKSAQAWSTVEGNFYVEISQRKPIARIVNKMGQSFYLSVDGFILPMSPNYTCRVLVVSGDIYFKSVLDRRLTVDSVVSMHGAANTVIDDIYEMATYIYNDSLLKRQIDHMHVTKNEFQLIPKVGTHVIDFGPVDGMLNKFLKLKVIYYKGFSNLGWNKYSRVNLKYKNQVVCTKR
jgi:cell division protein FtsQ